MRIEIQEIGKCETFISIFKHLKNFTDTVCVFIDEDKMYLQGMDGSHVCVYELFLQKRGSFHFPHFLFFKYLIKV